MTQRTTILVVDDMELNRAILRELLQQECIVLEGENGQEALDILEAHPEIDLVILDIVMPVLDGFSTLEIIRKNPAQAHLPVVICTEHAEVDVQVRALDLGSTDFITKPFNAQVVRHRVRNLIEMRKMERKIADQQRADQLRSTLNSIVSPLGLFEFTGEKVKALYLNQSLSDMAQTACDSPDAFYHDLLSVLYPEDAELLVDLLDGNQKNGTPVDMTYHITREDHSVSTHELHALSIRYEHYQNPVYLVSIADITNQRRTEVALRDTDQRLKSLINAVPGGIMIFEMQDHPHITYFNDTACDVFQMSRGEFQLQATENILAFVYPMDLHIVEKLIADFKANPRPMADVFRVTRKDGAVRWLRLSAAPLVTAEGMLLANCVSTDVSIEKEAELKLEQAFREMQYRSEHDALTGIWNRETFNQKTYEFLQRNPDVPHVIMALNIQRFKMINELFGVDVGDQVLITLSRGMERLFGDIGICGRMEADHFMVCLPQEELNMDRVMHMLDSEIKAQYIDYHIEILFGIYQVLNIHIAVDQMCDRATMALKTIKGSAVKRYAFYDENMRKTLVEEQGIIEEMNDALAQGQFIPFLQPIYSLATLKPVSAEVLVRWKHPKKGMISPGVFIPLFERNGFITKLDYSLWEQACVILHRWKTKGMPLVPLSVNISRIDLYSPHLCEDLQALLQKYDLEPSLLKLEITESAYIDDMEVLTSVLNRLRAAGFRILMDDFGSGYSSLNTLKDMPINVLKVDMLFLEELENSSRAASILTSMVRMAKWLELPVIAEGVETKAQLDFLSSIGCDEGQGYYFSRPIPVDEFEKLLREAGPVGAHRKTASIQEHDLDFLWNASMDVNLLFNSMIGGMAILELREGALEVRRVNDAFYHVMDCTPQQVFRDARNAFEEVYPDDRQPLLQACMAAVHSQRVEYVTLRRKHQDGHMMWLEAKIRHLSSQEGDCPVFLFIITDVTGQKEYEITRTLSRYTQVMSNVFTHVYELNFTQDRFSEIYDSTGKEPSAPMPIDKACGRLLKSIHPDDRALFKRACQLDFLNESIQSSPTSRSWTVELRAKNEQDEYQRVSHTFVKMERATGEDIYILCVNLIAEEHMPLDSGFAGLHGAGDYFTFEYEIAMDRLTLYLHPLLGEPYTKVVENHLKDLADSKQLPDKFKPLYTKALRSACTHNKERTLELPISADGEPFHWCRIYAMGVMDQERVTRVAGRILDISREKHAEELLGMEMQYRQAFLSDTLYVFDYDVATQQYELLHSAPDAHQRFKPFTNYTFEYANEMNFHPEDLPQLQCYIQKDQLALLHGQVDNKHPVRIKNLKDDWVWMELTAQLLEESESVEPVFLFYLKEVDRQKRAEAELRNRAEIDPVSLLYNRSAAQERVIRMLEAGATEHYAFFLVDIDNFKQVNDSYGHVVGDQAILSVSKALRKSFRSTDLVGRLGGDEFVVFIQHDGDADTVRAKAQKAVAAMGGLTFPDYPQMKLSISIGVSIAPQDGTTFDQLYQNADTAMYSIKDHGKNGYALYGDIQQSAPSVSS